MQKLKGLKVIKITDSRNKIVRRIKRQTPGQRERGIFVTNTKKS